MNKKFRILIKISLKFVPRCSISNNPALVLIMALRRTDNKPLCEPKMAPGTDAYMWHSASRPSYWPPGHHAPLIECIVCMFSNLHPTYLLQFPKDTCGHELCDLGTRLLCCCLLLRRGHGPGNIDKYLDYFRTHHKSINVWCEYIHHIHSITSDVISLFYFKIFAENGVSDNEGI